VSATFEKHTRALVERVENISNRLELLMACFKRRIEAVVDLRTAALIEERIAALAATSAKFKIWWGELNHLRDQIRVSTLEIAGDKRSRRGENAYN
jgi:hypothetical protein